MKSPRQSAAAEATVDGTRLPISLVYTTLLICALPLALALFGVDLGSPGPGSPEGPADPLPSGPITHTLLEWTAVCLAAFTVLLSLLHYSTERDVITPVIGVALLASGIVDAYHMLAADHLISASTPNQDFIPFTWALSRLFNSTVMLVIPALLVFPRRDQRGLGPLFVSSVAIVSGAVAFLSIWICTTSSWLPQTQFPDALITRPFDLVPLTAFAAAALFVYPRLVRSCPGIFSKAVLLSAVPNIATQLYMAFGSSALFDNFFNVAHGTKIVAYGVLLAGLSIEYVSSHLDKKRMLAVANEALRIEMDERIRLEGELRTTAKVEAVGRLAGGVAHDFNNLVTTIGVYAELLLAGLPEDSPLRNEVGQIQRANQQSAALTQQLLTLGRRSHVQVDFLDLNEVVSDAAPMLQHLLSTDTKLELQLEPKPQPVWGNIDELQQILINLATNARDAMTEPGVFSVTISRCTAQELTERGIGDPPTSDEYVSLEIADSGTGMSPETRDRAFDPFFTTKESEQGAGLGLSIVHGILRQAEGHVRLETAPGSGARFELYWPLAISESQDVSSFHNTKHRGHYEEILLVEDEDDLRNALERVLEQEGYSVTPAENGQAALELVRKRGNEFDLVVSDVIMPHMNGFELAERLGNIHPRGRILLMSGHLNDAALDHQQGDLPLLAKPFSTDQLTARVRELLDEAT